MTPLDKVLVKFSLGTQLLVLGIGALLFLSIAFTLFNTKNQSAELERFFTSQATALAFNIAVSSSGHILEKDFAVIESILQKAGRFSDLKSAVVTDASGLTLSKVVRDFNTGQLRPEYGFEVVSMVESVGFGIVDDPHIHQTESDLVVIDHITVGERIGYVFLTFDLDPLVNKKLETIDRNISLALLLILPVAVGLWIFIRKSIVQLRVLKRYSKVIANNHGSVLDETFSSIELDGLYSSLEWASKTLQTKSEYIQESKDKADRANELKSIFLANMSHEIRTPLNGILGLTEVVLGNENIQNESRSDLKLVHHSAEHLLRVVNDILDFSKIEANHLDISPHIFCLREQIEALISVVTRSYARPGVKVTCDIEADIPNHLVGDCNRIMQILNNLLSNALKFTEFGEVSLRVKSALPNGYQFIVTDTGIGIGEKDQKNIFFAFSQGDPGTSRKYGGTGLGLTITQRLLRLMGSEISLKSELGRGTVFSFNLNLPTAENSKCSNADSCMEDHIEISTNSPKRQNLISMNVRALVAEDNIVNQQLIAYTLTGLGVSYRLVANGQEAIHAVYEEPFDLVFMDLHMPGMGGIKATETILSDARNKGLKIVGLTADALPETRLACLSAGMSCVVTKPFNKSDISKILKNFSLTPLPLLMSNFSHSRETLRSKIQQAIEDIPLLIDGIEVSFKAKKWTDTKLFIAIALNYAKLFGEVLFEGFLKEIVDNFHQVGELTEDDLFTILENLRQLNVRLCSFSPQMQGNLDLAVAS